MRAWRSSHCPFVQLLRSELEGQRKRAADLEEMVAAVRSGSMAAGTSNKKDEDAYDVEAGGPAQGASIKTMASMVRKAPPPLNHHIMVHAARRVDRLVGVLDKRPGARMGLLMYFILLHFLIILF